jgi:muconolactone delta-isomerase
MPKFTVKARVDAFVDYVAEIKAETVEEAVRLADEGAPEIVWKKYGVVEFDARAVVALDDYGNEIEGTERGDFV